jgi:glutathione S-transferase
LLTVHHLNNSRSHRILWLLEELELDYEIVEYQRHPKTMLAPRELREVHPLGKSPVVTDQGRTVAESGAIIEYVLDEYGEGRLRPAPDSPQYLRYRYWMHYAEGSAMTPFLLKLIFNRLPQESPWALRPVVALVAKGVNAQFVDPRIKLHMDYWEEELAERSYFVGDEFTAADIQMSFPLEASTARAEDADSHPRVSALVDRLRERPAYKRAIERGGEFSLTM